MGVNCVAYENALANIVNQINEIEFLSFDSILYFIRSTVECQTASLLIINKNCKRLKTVAQFGDGCNLINAIHFKMGTGLAAWLAQKRRVVCLSDIHRGARHGHNPIRSFVAIPIYYHENVIGIVNLAHITPNAYGSIELKLLQDAIQLLAPHVHNLVLNCEQGS
jgi:GAF domain-containing protein